MKSCAEPDALAASVRATGPDATQLAGLLAAVDSGRLSERGRVDALVALEEQKAVLEAAQLRVMMDMLAADDDPDDKQWVREDIAAALRISPRTAGNRLALAESVVVRFPGMLKLLETGRVSLMHIRKLDELTANADDDTARLVEDLVLDSAQTHTVGEFARRVRRAVLKVEGCSAEERHELARKDRRVSIRPADHGMAELYWLLPADEAAQVAALIEADCANPHPGDPRVADQRRSDALFQRITAGQRDSAAGARATVLVTVPLSVLSGDSEAPGELAGHGAIPAGLARRIAADPRSTWKRLIVDEQGRLLDYGRTTYRPPADLARHVVARASPTGHRYIRRGRPYTTDADPPPPEPFERERPPLPEDPPF